MIEYFTTLVEDEDGKIYDLGKLQFLGKNKLAVNAWTEKIGESRDPVSSVQQNK